MSSRNLKIEEYVPAGQFLLASFTRDRTELMTRFSEFTPAFLAAFSAQLLLVKEMEQAVILTQSQKQTTQSLYALADEVNKDLNFLSFYFKRTGLDAGLITNVKDDLKDRNIEGACDKLGGLIQYVIANQDALEAVGMTTTFPSELESNRSNLLANNTLQNEYMNQKGLLYQHNSAELRKLYDDYMRVILAAGKLFYNGNKKEDEYTLTKLISRMRVDRGNAA